MAETASGSDKYRIHLKLGKAIPGDVYVPELKEHRFFLAGRPWLLPTETRTVEETKITPNLTLRNTREIKKFNSILFQIGEQ